MIITSVKLYAFILLCVCVSDLDPSSRSHESKKYEFPCLDRRQLFFCCYRCCCCCCLLFLGSLINVSIAYTSLITLHISWRAVPHLRQSLCSMYFTGDTPHDGAVLFCGSCSASWLCVSCVHRVGQEKVRLLCQFVGLLWSMAFGLLALSQTAYFTTGHVISVT